MTHFCNDATFVSESTNREAATQAASLSPWAIHSLKDQAPDCSVTSAELNSKRAQKNAEGGYMQSELSKYKRVADCKRPRTSLGKLLVFICLLTIVPVAFCQGVSGRIVGTIQDASGAVVPNVSVNITNQDTGISTKIVTNSNGEYRVDNLPPGNYQVRVEAPGFRAVVSNGNVVTVDLATVVDITLVVGSATETVQV